MTPDFFNSIKRTDNPSGGAHNSFNFDEQTIEALPRKQKTFWPVQNFILQKEPLPKNYGLNPQTAQETAHE